MQKILVICGPTATGKTSLGIKLAKKFNGEIVSADSRQVYKHMDIGTGKEWPPAQRAYGPDGKNLVTIHGYDLVDPKEKYSVSEYFKEMKFVISDIWKRNKLPIIVGGTGLYIKSLIDGIATVDIPKNENLRSSLESLSVDELFNKLAILDSSKAASMNLSDRKNPRRLVRAIEVATWKIENETQNKVVEEREKVLDKDVSVLMIGLTSNIENLSERVRMRVDQRMNDGFIDEVEDLLKMGVSWKMQSMNSLGYKDVEGFFKNGETFEDFITKWERNEIKYIKRQITWFKKDERIIWFDLENKKLFSEVEKLVNKWYSSIINGTKN